MYSYANSFLEKGDMKRTIMKLTFIFITQTQAADFFRLSGRVVPVRITLRDDLYSEAYETYETALDKAQRLACKHAHSVVCACWCNFNHQLTFYVNPHPETITSLSRKEFSKHLVYVWDNNNESFQIQHSR